MTDTDNNIFGVEKTEALKKMIHECIDELCGYPGPEFETYISITGWKLQEFNSIHRLFTKLFKNPSILHHEKEKMPEEYLQFPEFLQLLVSNCLKERKEHLIEVLIRDISSYNAPTMTDFDWRIKYVMGCSKKASRRETLLQLDLMLKDKESEDILTIEMDKTELDTFITALESIQ